MRYFYHSFPVKHAYARARNLQKNPANRTIQ